MWNRNFVLLWQGLFVSQVGTQFFNLALLYWILETTGSATLMGLVLMASTLPGALAGPFAGAIADLFDRKTLIVAADLVRGVFGVLLVVALVVGSLEVALAALIVTQVVSGLCGAVFNPSLNAMIPDIVPKKELTRANSVLQGTNALTATGSYGVGGYLYALLGAPWLFLINSISFLLSAASECFIKLERRVTTKLEWRSLRARVVRDTVEGLRYVWSNPGLRLLLIFLGVINFIIVPTGIALPILVRDFLGRGPEFLGLMGAFQAGGGVLGFVVTGIINVPPHRRTALVSTCLLLAGVIVVLLGYVRSPYMVVALVFLFGLILPMINVNIIALLQGTTPSNIRGRVMGVMSTIGLGLIPVSQGLSGIAIDAVNQEVPLIYAFVGLVFVLLVLGNLMSPAFRKFLSTDYSENSSNEAQS